MARVPNPGFPGHKRVVLGPAKLPQNVDNSICFNGMLLFSL